MNHSRDIMDEFGCKPVWDGNETWLVMGGAGVVRCFARLVYSVFSACFGISCVFNVGWSDIPWRGIEFGSKQTLHQIFMGIGPLPGGSFCCCLCTGTLLVGAYVQGLHQAIFVYVGGAIRLG